MALVSAHRGGAGDEPSRENTVTAFEAAITAGVDYVEFDVRLTADGHPVLFHDDLVGEHELRSIAAHRYDELADAQLLDLDVVLDLLAGRVGAHVDLKVRGEEIPLVQRIVDALGTDRVIITSAEDSSVRSIRRWSREQHPGLLVGLSSSARSHDGRLLSRWSSALASCFPRLRIRLSGANLVVSHKRLARLWLMSYARRRGLPLVVWTVDDTAELQRWMNEPDVWIVTTNHPRRALAMRRRGQSTPQAPRAIRRNSSTGMRPET